LITKEINDLAWQIPAKYGEIRNPGATEKRAITGRSDEPAAHPRLHLYSLGRDCTDSHLYR
jgi:hypothetical protein